MVRRMLAYLLIGGCFAFVLLTVLVYAFGCVAVLDDPWLEADMRAWQSAYPALAELPDFDWLSEQADGSFLLHRVGEADQSAVLPEEIADMLHSRDLLGLRKSGDDVFFTTSGAVDDEVGYVITGDGEINMEGLNQIERVGESIFRFSTRK